MYLIYGARYKSYNWALKQASRKTQTDQRLKMFEKFTKACVRSPKFSKWKCKEETTQAMATRSRKMRFKPVVARTQTYAKSPIPQRVALADQIGITETGCWKFKSGKIILL